MAAPPRGAAPAAATATTPATGRVDARFHLAALHAVLGKRP
jgi:hypothetical protein